MTPEEQKLVGEALQVFADAMPNGWKVYENGDRRFVGRRFEYRNGARALLSAQPLRLVRDPKVWLVADPIDLVKEWTSQVNLQFAAGPEADCSGKLAAVQEWAYCRDGWLSVPYTMQECKTAAEAESIAATLPAIALVLLAAVFDIDPYEGRTHLVKKLATACVPVRAGRSQA